ncbi:MAG TPA: hypothetical protein VGZ69_04835 [Candidatus Rhabdochlamydia sp.]|jgi:hypothetical protein|nr:hypothetical protein [Candidatus Rhabdochlamydia sp.]
MSEVGKVPNPLNPANDPKKDKHRLGSNQFREKFDYRKKEEASSGGNRQRYSPEEEEQTPKTAKTPNPDSIFKSSNSQKSSFQVKKNAEATHKKITPSSEKEMQKKSIEEISVEKKVEEKQIEEKSIKKKEIISAKPTPEEPPPKTSFPKHTPPTLKSKERKKEEAPTSFEPLANIQPNQPSYQPPVLPTGSAFTSNQINQLFDRIAGVMTVMELSGTTTTELTLSGEEFASSVFYGARITITEHTKTAPKSFNVQLSANPQAVTLFEKNMPNLLANFASGNYAFRIHRLETNIEERPLFKRKGSFGNDQQPMQGDS